MTYSNQQATYGQGYPSGPEQISGRGTWAQQASVQGGGGELAVAMAKVTITDQHTGQAYTQQVHGNGTQQTTPQGAYYGATIQHQHGGYSQSQLQQTPAQAVSGPPPTTVAAAPYIPTSQAYNPSLPGIQSHLSGVFNTFAVAGSLSVSHSTQPGVNAGSASGSYAGASSSAPATHHQGHHNAHMSPAAQNPAYPTFAPPPNQQCSSSQPQYAGPPQQASGEHSHTVSVSATKPIASSRKHGLFGKLSAGQKIAMGAAGDIASAVLTKERKDYLRDKLEHQMSKLDISGATPIHKLTGTAAPHAASNSQASTGTHPTQHPAKPVVHAPAQSYNTQQPVSQTQHVAIAYTTQQTSHPPPHSSPAVQLRTTTHSATSYGSTTRPHPTIRPPAGPAPIASRPGPANRPPVAPGSGRPAGAPPPPRPGPGGGPQAFGPPMIIVPMGQPAGGVSAAGGQPPNDRDVYEGQERGYVAGGDASNGAYGDSVLSRQVYDESSASYGTYSENSNIVGGSNERGGGAYGDTSGTVDGFGVGEGSWATQDPTATANTAGLPTAENAILVENNTNLTIVDNSTNISNSATVEGNTYTDMSVAAYTDGGMGGAVASGTETQATGSAYQEYGSGVTTDMGMQAYGGGTFDTSSTGVMGNYPQAYAGSETVTVQGAYTETTTFTAQETYTGVPATATQDSYIAQGTYSGQDTIAVEGTYTQETSTGPDTYTGQGIYSEQATYPNQVAYPNDGTCAQQDYSSQDYSSQNTLPAQDTYGADAVYTDTTSYAGEDPYAASQDYGSGQVESYQQPDPYAATEAYPEAEIPYESYDYSADYDSSIADAFAIQDSALF